jgi:hypothetical protein
MDSPRGVEAVERAMRLLACFEAAGETLSLAQLAQRSRLYKSTILRLAASLRKSGFLQRCENGRFSLGEELRRLGELARVTEELERFVAPELKQLTTATAETVSFYVRQGRHRICLFREVSPGSVATTCLKEVVMLCSSEQQVEFSRHMTLPLLMRSRCESVGVDGSPHAANGSLTLVRLQFRSSTPSVNCWEC